MKDCTKCKNLKPLSDFRPRKLNSGRMSLASHCNFCHSESCKKYTRTNRIQNTERKKKWYREDKAKNPDKAKNLALKRKYGITLAEKAAMWEAQEKKCAICPRDLNTLFSAKVDHRHSTGKVRELLCARCNAYVGYIKESFDTALNLAKYIQEHNGVI